MPGDELQVVQGTLDVLVLKTLSRGAQHGYAIARWIREITGDELRVEDRALYVSLHRMEERGWIESEWGVSDQNRRAKFYQLTPEGRAALAAQSVTWERYAAAVFKVLRAGAT
jgi:PadR family transcriptional regulator, regulatory protein PadR